MPKSYPSTSPAAKTTLPSGCAALVRIEEIHRQLRGVAPASTHAVTAGSLARDLGVSYNTVCDDLDLLRLMFAAPAGSTADGSFELQATAFILHEEREDRPAWPLLHPDLRWS